MSLRNQFVDIAEPARVPLDRPPVTAALTAKIDRVDRDAVKQVDVKRSTLNKNLAVKQAAKPSKGSVTVRSSPESFRAYHRESMRRRRAAAKIDSVELASTDAA